MKDDITGEPLVRRSDDNIETLGKRIISYRQLTAPVVEYYQKSGLVYEIDANQEPAVVWNNLIHSLTEEERAVKCVQPLGSGSSVEF